MKKSRYFLVSFLVVIMDQLTKYIARATIPPFESIQVLPFLHLVSVRNTGAAFGMFKVFGNTIFVIISLAAIVFVLFLLLRGMEDKLALALILGGAIGNLIDRVAYSHVTDFIDVFAGRFHWPAFNIADSALTIGILLMIVRAFFQTKSLKTA